MQKLSTIDSLQMTASYRLSAFWQAAFELVLNAVDASASEVAVHVDLGAHRIDVIDNGSGFSDEALYNLSNSPEDNTLTATQTASHAAERFGCRHSTLRNIIALSRIVRIASRSFDRAHYTRIAFVDGKQAVDEQTAAAAALEFVFEHGCRIVVEDFNYKLVVRQKVMTNASCIELERLAAQMKAFAIACPATIFTLRNEANGEVLVRSKRQSNSATVFRDLFGTEFAHQLHTFESKKAKALSTLVRKSKLRIEGFVAKHGHVNDSLQFIFINSLPVFRSLIHKEINEIFDQVPAIVKDNSSRKRLWPVFILNVKSPRDMFEICYSGDETLLDCESWTAFYALLSRALTDWLLAHRLVSPKQLPLPLPEAATQDSLDEAARANIAIISEVVRRPTCDLPPTPNEPQIVAPALLPEWWTELDDNVQQQPYQSFAKPSTGEAVAEEEEAIAEPGTLSNVAAEPTAVPSAVASSSRPSLVRRKSSLRSSAYEFLPRPKRKRVAFGEMPQGDVVSEEPLSRCPNSLLDRAFDDNWKVSYDLQQISRSAIMFRLHATGEQHGFRITKRTFELAELIGHQVARKFIVCKMPANEDQLDVLNLIVAMDQHAADERVRLDRLYQANKVIDPASGALLQLVQSESLPSAIDIEVSATDVRLMSSNPHAYKFCGLSRWMVVNDWTIRIGDVPRCLLQKHSSASVDGGVTNGIIWARLIADVKVLISEISEFTMKTNVVGLCSLFPTVLRETLNMQACRTAIKFDMELADADCAQLLSNLKRCKNSFQCAHGRPTLYPLYKLPS